LFAVVAVLGSVFGILFGVGLLYGNLAIRSVLRVYVDIVRGVPLIVTIFLLFYLPVAYGINLSSFASISLALSIFSAAQMAEIVRGAVTSIPKSQTDAAKSIGLTFWPRFLSVILPQAVPLMIGPWTNLAVDMFKGTSLAILVSQADFLFSIQKRATAKGHYLAFYVAAMLVYFVCCFTISRLGAWLTRRMRIGIAS
ncbi:MAG: amino acid ABC transporter permease, partial [Thermomicrobiales bacterium]